MSKTNRIRPAHKKVTIGSIIAEIVVVIAVLSALAPLLWGLFMSLKTNNEIFTKPFEFPEVWMWSNYPKAFKIISVPKLVVNTLIDEVFSLTGGMLITFFSSFGIARFRFGSGKLQNTIYTFFISGIIVPFFVVMLPLYMLMVKLRLTDTLWSLILVHLAGAVPMNTLLMVGSFRSIPGSLEESAAIDGAGMWRILFSIYCPLLMPTLATILILSFLGIWNDFQLALIMLTTPAKRTIALASSLFKNLYTMDYSLMTAGVMILISPQLLVFAFFQRYIIDGIVEGAVKG